jgi:predicted DNA-binding transcriptional regulator YafY
VYKLDLHDFPDTIDETEIQALDVAIQKLGNNLNARKLLEYLKAKLTSRLYRKIERTEPTKAAKRINDIDQTINSNYAFVGPRLIVDFEEKVKATLDSMISKQHEVSFTYYKKTITVQPLGIIYGPNNVYLLAYEYKDEKPSSKPQYYILTEISNVADTGNWFARDESFSLKKYASSMFGIYNDGTVYDVEWLIKKPRIIKVAQQYLFHPTQQFVTNTDGSLTVKMRTGGLRAISVFLAQWGGDIIPVKPAALLTEYENLLKNCYNSIRPEEDLSSK